MCDNITSQQYVSRVNAEYMKLALRGLTIMVSSGDSGAPGRTNLDCDDDSDTVHAVFPGSSPWVTSVGAALCSKKQRDTKIDDSFMSTEMLVVKNM